jgi:hypothetical protein
MLDRLLLPCTRRLAILKSQCDGINIHKLLRSAIIPFCGGVHKVQAVRTRGNNLVAWTTMSSTFPPPIPERKNVVPFHLYRHIPTGWHGSASLKQQLPRPQHVHSLLSARPSGWPENHVSALLGLLASPVVSCTSPLGCLWQASPAHASLGTVQTRNKGLVPWGSDAQGGVCALRE